MPTNQTEQLEKVNRPLQDTSSILRSDIALK